MTTTTSSTAVTAVQATQAAPAATAIQQVPPRPPGMEWSKRGLIFNDLDQLWRMCCYYVAAQKQMGIKPENVVPAEAVLIKAQMGAEMGLSFMQAQQNIYVVNGRPCLWGDAVPGICMASNVYDQSAFKEWFEGEGDDFAAVCQVRRVGGNIVEGRFSVKDAKTAGLWGKTGYSGRPTPWITSPKRMLMWRARTFAHRDAFPDIMRGIGVKEEAEDEIIMEIGGEQAAIENIQSRIAGGRAAVVENRPAAMLPPVEPQAPESDEAGDEPAEVQAETKPSTSPTIACRKCLAKGQPADGPCGKCNDPEPAVAGK